MEIDKPDMFGGKHEYDIPYEEPPITIIKNMVKTKTLMFLLDMKPKESIFFECPVKLEFEHIGKPLEYTKKFDEYNTVYGFFANIIPKLNLCDKEFKLVYYGYGFRIYCFSK